MRVQKLPMCGTCRSSCRYESAIFVKFLDSVVERDCREDVDIGINFDPVHLRELTVRTAGDSLFKNERRRVLSIYSFTHNLEYKYCG